VFEYGFDKKLTWDKKRS